MAWTTPLTAVSNTALTAAQWNASVRDNLALTPAGLATTSSQLWVSTAANAGAMRTPAAASVVTAQTTNTIATYGDLTTVGPTVTATTGTACINSIYCSSSNSSAAATLMSFAVSGASTIAAADTWSIRVNIAAGLAMSMGMTYFTSGLTSGSNTFTAKYTTASGGTGSWSNRHLIAFPL